MFGVAACPSPAASKLERAFVRLRAGITEECSRRERLVDESRGESLAGRCGVEVRDVDQAVGRGMQRGAEAFIAVAERVDGDSADEIQVALAFGVDQINA